jgi:hypothetical protein
MVDRSMPQALTMLGYFAERAPTTTESVAALTHDIIRHR